MREKISLIRRRRSVLVRIFIQQLGIFFGKTNLYIFCKLAIPQPHLILWWFCSVVELATPWWFMVGSEKGLVRERVCPVV